MRIDLTSRHAVVCGATRGIGRAAAIELGAQGAEVTLLSRSEESLRAALAELPQPAGQTHGFFAADFADAIQVKAAIEQVLSTRGAVHILVNNTGGPPGGAAIDAEVDEYRAAFEAHLVANQILTSAVVPGMKESAYGRIINVISTSVRQPIPGLGVSNTIRGAVASWAKTISHELGPFGITVNNVLPGFTDTDRLSSLITAKAAKAGVSEDDVRNEMINSVPARRFGKPEETAEAIAFLASPAAAYISGVNIPVDGGRLGAL